METFGSAPTSQRMQNAQFVQDDFQLEIMSSHCPHCFQSSYEYLIVFISQVKILELIKWSYRSTSVMFD